MYSKYEKSISKIQFFNYYIWSAVSSETYWSSQFQDIEV